MPRNGILHLFVLLWMTDTLKLKIGDSFNLADFSHPSLNKSASIVLARGKYQLSILVTQSVENIEQRIFCFALGMNFTACNGIM